MRAGGIDVGRIPQPELHVDGCGDADQLRDLVVADEAADVVGRLDVDVERHIDGCANRGDLRQRQVGGEIDRRCAELLEDARARGIRRRQHHRDLRLHVAGQEACALRLGEEGEHAEVGDQDRPEAVRGGAHAVLEVRDDLLLAMRARGEALMRTCRRREPPRRVRSREQADLHLRVGCEAGHLVELVVGLHEDAGALGHALDADVEALRLREHGLETARPLGRRDLDPVLRAVGEPLRGLRQLVQVATREADAGEEAPNRVHGPVYSGASVVRMRADVLDRFAAVTETIREPEQLRTYECDGLTGRRVVPSLVALPGSVEEVQAVVRLCNEEGIPFVARGAGTGLSGGALPVAEGIVISLARLTRILDVDLELGQVVVEPGVANLDVTRAVAADGFYYAPDPSSQQVCTIGGNVAENSGGAHCLKYGFTTNHVLAAEIVLPDGELVELSVWDEGPDLLGAFVGSEGTLGIATKLTLRVLRVPEEVRTLLAGFLHTDDAGAAVSGTIAAGILPAAIEMMDAITIEAAEAAVNANYPPNCGAVLIIELDGPTAQVDEDLVRVEELCAANGAREIRIASDPADRANVWRGRKAAFAAMGRVSPDYYVQDGVVPRTKLPEVLRRIDTLSQEHGLRVGNVFHAGDGNLHPLVLYDGRVEGEAKRAETLAGQILEACID